MKTLRIVARLVKMNVMLTLEYRVGFFISMINLVMNPTIALLVWLTVSESGVPLPYDRGQFVTYFVLMALVSLATQTWTAEYVEQDIRDGHLNKSLLRPAPNILHYVDNNLGEKVVKLGFLLDYSLGSLAFWLQDVSGVLSLERLLYGLLAGRFVPLAFFPPELTGLLEALPFRYLLSFPLELLTADLPPAALARGFAWQAAYVLGALAAYRAVWRYGLRAYAATGA